MKWAKWNGDKVVADVKKARTRLLKEGAEFLLQKANLTIPHDEGTMERSGTTSVSENTATVSYNTPYAVRQHEDTRLRHPNGRRAKWLERSLDENRGEIHQHIIDGLKEVLN